MRAKFHIDHVFSVEGRGTVLQGTIVDGEVGVGMRLAGPGLSGLFVIGEIDAVHGKSIPLGSLGLVLREGATGTPEELRRLLEGNTVEVE